MSVQQSESKKGDSSHTHLSQELLQQPSCLRKCPCLAVDTHHSQADSCRYNFCKHGRANEELLCLLPSWLHIEAWLCQYLTMSGLCIVQFSCTARAGIKLQKVPKKDISIVGSTCCRYCRKNMLKESCRSSERKPDDIGDAQKLFLPP